MLNFNIGRQEWCFIIRENLKFRKKIFGGYSKTSVKKQFKVLEEEYQKILNEECERHNEEIKAKDEEIKNLLNNTRRD